MDSFSEDVMRLSALFVAYHGDAFQLQLMTRETSNPLFDFLKPNHVKFRRFSQLVDQYKKVIWPPVDIVVSLREEGSDRMKILRDVHQRVEKERHESQAAAQRESAEERERLEFNRIDWHDFVIVNTIDFQPTESDLPPLCSPDEVGSRVIEQQRFEEMSNAEMDGDWEI